MPCYVNLPLSWVHHREAWLDWFLEAGVAPELGLDATALRLPLSWHQRIAARLREAGLACATHLPFMGVQPVAGDAAQREQSRAALRTGADLARLYGAAHMIGHPYYEIPRDGSSNTDISPSWLDGSLQAWAELPDRAEAPLFLENTYETSALPLAALVKHLCTSMGRDRVGICFDIGHWHSFAGGHVRQDLDAWLTVLAPFRTHLHLHDNRGRHDEHLGLGVGDVPLLDFFHKISGKEVSATMEPHNADAFAASLAWLQQNPDVARHIRWTGLSASAPPLPGFDDNL